MFESRRFSARGHVDDDTTLAYQARSSLPDEMVRFLDSQSQGSLSAIVWIEPHRLRFTAYFTLNNEPYEQRNFKYRAPGQRLNLRMRSCYSETG